MPKPILLLVGAIVFFYIFFVKKQALQTKEITVPNTDIQRQNDVLANSIEQLSYLVKAQNNDVTPTHHMFINQTDVVTTR